MWQEEGDFSLGMQFSGNQTGWGMGELEKTKKLPAPSSAALALTVWSLPVSLRTRVSWQLLAGRSKGSSFSCSRPAFLLQRVEKGSDGGSGVRPGAQENNWESLEQLNRGDREFCSLATAPPSRDSPSSAAARAPGREQPAGRGGIPSCGSGKALRRPLSPRLRAAVPGEWARGVTSLGAPPPACPDPTRRARARALCIKPSSSAKVEEVGLPPGWEAGGNSAPVVFRQRERVEGAGGGVRPPTPGRELGRDSRAWSLVQLLAPYIRLTPSIFPGGCGKCYSIVPRTWEEYWVPLGLSPGGRTLSQAGPCVSRRAPARIWGEMAAGVRASESWVLVCFGALLARWVATGKGRRSGGKS